MSASGTFLDNCITYPLLKSYYDSEKNAEERAAAISLWLEGGEEVEKVKNDVISKWEEMGLLEKVERQEWGTVDDCLAVPVEVSLSEKIKINRKIACIEHKKRIKENENQVHASEKKRVQQRRKQGFARDFGASEELSGVVVALEPERGTGEIFVPERHCNAVFHMEWADYGLKRMALQDKVRLTIERRRADFRGRDRATGVKPAIHRELTPYDIAEFCNSCKTTGSPEKIITKILVSQPDWIALLNFLAQKPTAIGSSTGPSWVACVTSIVDLCAYPGLQESRYRPVLSKFYRSLQSTPLPLLVREVAKLASDGADIQHGLDIAVFAENLRMFCYKTGSVHDIPDTYFDGIVGLLVRLNKAHTAGVQRPNEQQQDQLRRLCARIRRGTEDRRLFPEPEAFIFGIDDERNPMHHLNLPVTTSLPFKDVDDYVGTHFSLLKSDVFAEAVSSVRWRIGLTENLDEKAVEDHKYSTQAVSGVEVIGEALGDRGLWIVLKFMRSDSFNPLQQLESGTLVLILGTTDMEKACTEQKMWWATVPFSDASTASAGLAIVEVVEGDPHELIRCLKENQANGVSQRESFLFETKVFLHGSKPVLEALDHLRKQPRLPFNNTLLKGACKAEVKRLPGFVPLCYKDAFENIVRRMLNRFTYEPGQAKALRWLPHRPVLLVQGPPGTGKSFIGCRLVECIAEFRIRMQSGELKNEYQAPDDANEPEEVENPGPIVVLTYKNHSLDEFLIDCINSGVWCGDLRDPTRCACKSTGPSKYCCQTCCDRQGHSKKLVRVGGRSQSSKLQHYNLSNLTKLKGDHRGKLKSLRKEAERIAALLKRLDTLDLDNDMIRDFMDSSQLDKFALGEDDLVTTWKEWLPDEPIVMPSDDFHNVQNLGKHILSIGLDPDEVDTAFLKEKTLTEDIRREFQEARERAVSRNNAGNGGETNMQTMKLEGKSFTSLDEDFLRNLRAKRAFYSSFAPVMPPSLARRHTRPEDGDDEVPEMLKTGNLIPPSCANTTDLWSMGDDDRCRLAAYWVAKTREKLAEKFENVKKEFDGMLVLDQYAFDDARLTALKGADIIGLTTTGAAMNQSILRAVKPSVLMVEEAAEILESQILSCFVDSVKQIILIGDHKQLMPSTENRLYARYNHFDTSLFQRLIENCEVPCVMLTEQRRMRRAIADIVRPIYKSLTDYETLATRTMHYGGKKVLGLPHLPAVTFWSHKVEEQQSSVGRSIMNSQEVRMVTFLAQYLVSRKALRSEQVTVLTPYLGQARALSTGLAAVGLGSIEVLTVDRFQGDENDIVIVSLTRTAKLTSFMKLENRMCVACSRARFGFFMIGSPKMLQMADHWKRTLEIIKTQATDGMETVTHALNLPKPGSDPPVFSRIDSRLLSFPDPTKDDMWKTDHLVEGDYDVVEEDEGEEEEEEKPKPVKKKPANKKSKKKAVEDDSSSEDSSSSSKAPKKRKK